MQPRVISVDQNNDDSLPNDLLYVALKCKFQILFTKEQKHNNNCLAQVVEWGHLKDLEKKV